MIHVLRCSILLAVAATAQATNAAIEVNATSGDLHIRPTEGSVVRVTSSDLQVDGECQCGSVSSPTLDALREQLRAISSCPAPDVVDESVVITDGNRDASKGEFGVTIKCAPGYEGSPSVTPCEKKGPFDRSPYTYTTCSPTVCTSPSFDQTVAVSEASLDLTVGWNVSIECADGYSGSPSVLPCETSGPYTYVACKDTNECAGDATPCKNGGNCINNDGGFACDCAGTGFEGNTCADDVDECSLSPCKNGGKCDTPRVNAFTCDCAGTGFKGNTCADDIDECAADPCGAHATCSTPEVSSFRCMCEDGYSGGGIKVTKDCVSTRVDAFDGKGCDAHFGSALAFNHNLVSGYARCASRWGAQFELEQGSGDTSGAADWCGAGGFNGNKHLLYGPGQVRFSFNVPVDGQYTILMRYASDDTARYQDWEIDNVAVPILPGHGRHGGCNTGGWCGPNANWYSEAIMKLTAGTHQFKITGQGCCWNHADSIAFTKVC